MTTVLKAFTQARLDELDRNPFEAARIGDLERSFINDILIDRKKSIRMDMVAKFAAALDLTVADVLASGVVAASASIAIPVMGRVGAGAKISFDDDEAEIARGEMILFPGSRRIAAVVVHGDSQRPRYLPGAIVLYDLASLPIEDLVGEYAIVELWNGDRLLKIVRRGALMGTWDLESDNAEPIRNANVKPIGNRIVGELRGRTPQDEVVKIPEKQPRPKQRAR